MIWRYFGWANQTLAMLVLWSAAIFLAKESKFHWIASVPATFMTAVSFVFIMQAQIGFSLPYVISNFVGIAAAVGAFVLFFVKFGMKREEVAESVVETD